MRVIWLSLFGNSLADPYINGIQYTDDATYYNEWAWRGATEVVVTRQILPHPTAWPRCHPISCVCHSK